MIIIQNTLFVFIAIIILCIVIYNINIWSRSLQEIYIRSAKKQKLNNFHWEKPWIQILFKIGIIFSSMVVMAIVYSVLFGTIHLR